MTICFFAMPLYKTRINYENMFYPSEKWERRSTVKRRLLPTERTSNGAPFDVRSTFKNSYFDRISNVHWEKKWPLNPLNLRGIAPTENPDGVWGVNSRGSIDPESGGGSSLPLQGRSGFIKPLTPRSLCNKNTRKEGV
jgi:hypothetical protein